MKSWKIVAATIVLGASSSIPLWPAAAAPMMSMAGPEMPAATAQPLTNVQYRRWHHHRHHGWHHRRHYGPGRRCSAAWPQARSLAVRSPTVRPGRMMRLPTARSVIAPTIRRPAPIWGMTAIGVPAHKEMPRGVAETVRGPAHRRFGRWSPSYLVAAGRGTPCRSLMGTQLFFRRWFRGAAWTFRTLPAEQEPSLT